MSRTYHTVSRASGYAGRAVWVFVEALLERIVCNDGIETRSDRCDSLASFVRMSEGGMVLDALCAQHAREGCVS